MSSPILQWPDIEQVAKPDIMSTLDRATADCSRRYAKGKLSFELLAELAPAKVEQNCAAAKLLLDRLRDL